MEKEVNIGDSHLVEGRRAVAAVHLVGVRVVAVWLLSVMGLQSGPPSSFSQHPTVHTQYTE